MKKNTLRIMIEELDYYVETEWRYEEFPKVGDFICILIFCSDDDVKYFTHTPPPKYLHTDFTTVIDYLKYYRWQVVERAWNLEDGMTINCRRVDPTLI
ncbi:MAG: hypothetical protein SNG60_09325 [Rikenellaceae bacterium]